jgi:hypothetical protein
MPRREIARATTAITTFTRVASQSVARVPKASSSQKVAARQPARAPRVLTP